MSSRSSTPAGTADLFRARGQRPDRLGRVAIDKARSAALFRRPTKVFEDALASGRTAILALRGAVPLEGGLPLVAGGKIVGAIGASGGTGAAGRAGRQGRRRHGQVERPREAEPVSEPRSFAATRRRPAGRRQTVAPARPEGAKTPPALSEGETAWRAEKTNTKTRNPNIEIAQEATMRPIGEIAAEKLGIPDEAIAPYGKIQGQDRARLRPLAARPAERQADPRHRDHPDPGRRGQDDDHGRARRRAQPDRQKGDALPARGEPRARALASRAGRPAAAMPRSCRWRTSTSISPAICTRSAPPTTCSRRWSTTTSIGASSPRIDPRRVTWRRAIDMNDRALRSIVSSLGGVANGFPREDGFDITAASQVMAIFCLATDLQDLKRRLGNIIVGQTRERKPVTRRRRQGGRARWPCC